MILVLRFSQACLTSVLNCYINCTLPRIIACPLFIAHAKHGAGQSINQYTQSVYAYLDQQPSEVYLELFALRTWPTAIAALSLLGKVT